MWNRRDWLTLSVSAVAGFGMTVGLFLPRLANAVDDKPAAITNVALPALHLGDVQVTAALDAKDGHQVVLTVVNTGDVPATAAFRAQAMVIGPSNPLSRGRSMGQEVWKQEWVIDLKPGETKTIAAALPDAAFVVPTPAAQNPAPPSGLKTVPGFSVLQLSDVNAKGLSPGIMALTLSSGKDETAAVGPAAPAPAKGAS